MAGNIIWLASYPKSGNTWMRVFLTNYWRNADEPADINFLDPTPIASARLLFDEETGVESSDLTWAEIQRCRPDVYIQYSAAQGEDVTFCKIHDAYTTLSDGRPVFPPEATRGVVYIIRNPLSVAVSWAHHDGSSIDASIEAMACERQALAAQRQRLSPQLPQRLLSWSEHVRSWVDQPHSPVYVVRFEDMNDAPLDTFSGVVEFLVRLSGDDPQDIDPERIQRAIAFSSFEQMRAQEAEHGFEERLARSTAPFFRKGSPDAWREELTREQIAQIQQAHQSVMARFGYEASLEG